MRWIDDWTEIDMRRAWTISGIVIALAVVAVLVGGKYLFAMISVPLPTYPPVTKTVWMDQNWSKEQSAFYHHATQGSTTFGVPYEWFVALERPELSLALPGLLADNDYLDRYGFIASDDGASALPIGFEHGGPMISPTTMAHWTDPQSGKDMTSVGLTCAACHTGRMTYKGTSIYIDGGGAMINVDAIRKALAISLYLTRYVPGRFDRFANRVLGPNPKPEAKTALLDKLNETLVGFKQVQTLDKTIADRSVEEGIGRLDALNRIGNQLFALGMDIDANYAPTSAPVRYPHVWDASWFDWVQYNASIQQPMVRNAGEALGLGVKIDLTNKPAPTFRSAMDVDSIYKIEVSLRGPTAPSAEGGIRGLRSPHWPENLLPAIDKDKAAKGAALYQSLCQNCHLPAVGTPAFYDPKLRQNSGPHALIIPVKLLSEIGTDPAQAADMANRTVIVPPALGLTSNQFGPALGQLVEKAVTYWYDHQTPPIDADRRNVMNGELPNGIQAPLGYKSKPLDGIWATAPYLHNGSVPTLYAMLQPAAERPKMFTIGSREFDPVDVGLKTDPMEGGTMVDTSKRGDLNTGHEFDDATGRAGVIGRKLTEDERRELVEYMKTL